MNKIRAAQLLDAAADALDNGDDPFHQSFLVKHEVTFSECMEMAEWLACGARVVAFAIEHPETVSAAINGAHLAVVSTALGKALDRLPARTEGGACE